MKAEPVPYDQFERCKAEMTKLNFLVEEVERGLTIAENIHTHEARRALDKCSTDLETAAYWLSKAVAEATKAVKG